MQTWNPERAAVAVATLAIAVLVVPAVAAPLAPPAPDPYPRMAFVARNDNPFDALSVGAVAGAVGGVIAITRSDELSVAAATVLQEFDPDVVVIAGGPGAVSEGVELAIGDLGDWDVERAAGTNRDETAREIGRLINEYGLGRPAMLSTSSGQNVGDLYLGGHFEAESATIGGVDVPDALPLHWSAIRRDLDEIPQTGGGLLSLAEVEIEVPADGGVIEILASAVARNADTTEVVQPVLYVTLDEDSTDDSEAFFDSLVGMAVESVEPDALGNDNLRSLHAAGASTIDAGAHSLYLWGQVEDGSFQLPTLQVTWYPQGDAPPPGYDVPSA